MSFTYFGKMVDDGPRHLVSLDFGYLISKIKRFDYMIYNFLFSFYSLYISRKFWKQTFFLSQALQNNFLDCKNIYSVRNIKTIEEREKNKNHHLSHHPILTILHQLWMFFYKFSVPVCLRAFLHSTFSVNITA